MSLGFLKVLELLLSLTPAIVNTVQAVEQAIPGKKQGSKKLKVILDTVGVAARVAPAIREEVHDVRDGLRGVRTGAVTPENIAQITDGITGIVGNVVSIFNSAGVFASSDENQSAGE